LQAWKRYPWTGHAVLLGNRQLASQETDAILERFGKEVGMARRNYRQFIADGIDTGHRDDLVGGGLKRSQGERRKNEYESFDERVLGGGDFVDGLKQDSILRGKMPRVFTSGANRRQPGIKAWREASEGGSGAFSGHYGCNR